MQCLVIFILMPKNKKGILKKGFINLGSFSIERSKKTFVLKNATSKNMRRVAIAMRAMRAHFPN